jgi:cytochrome c peroxidase
VRALGLAALLFIAAASAQGADAAYQWSLPRGFPLPFVPADNPMSPEKVELGRRLFFEPALSVTGKHSCASCHEPALAFTDGRAVGVGATGVSTSTGAMSLVNVAYNVSFGWAAPGVRSLEEQMLQPLLNEHPVELGLRGREETVVRALVSDERYRAAFAKAFPEAGGQVAFDQVVKSIAAFERTLISGKSAFDRYVFGGEHDALGAAAKRGMALFYSERLGCGGCHAGFNFSGAWRDSQGATGEPSFARNGIGPEPTRVPTLRNIQLTAPYMHDGRFSTLEAVVAHYENAGLRADPANDGRRAFTLTATERRDLIAFLHSLTDSSFTARFAR